MNKLQTIILAILVSSIFFSYAQTKKSAAFEAFKKNPATAVLPDYSWAGYKMGAEGIPDVKGKILVSKMTDPGWVFLMSQAIALVTEKGSLLSHTAIVGRELGIPVVVAVQDATQRIKTGERIRVNGSTGTIERIESTENPA
jgi:phosphohistidine swiveling domain-containing protein